MSTTTVSTTTGTTVTTTGTTTLSTTLATTCGTPPAITGGTLITSNATTAVYECSSGYVMANSSYTSCVNGVWDTEPTCTLDGIIINVTNNNYHNDEFPVWLTYIIAATVVLLAFFILTCLLLWCCQLLGCFGAGGLFGEHQPCCRRENNSVDQTTKVSVNMNTEEKRQPQAWDSRSNPNRSINTRTK